MGCMDRAVLEELLGDGLSLAEIGRRVGLKESTVGYWVEKHGLHPVNRQRHLARGGLQRDDLERLIATDASISEIATSVGRSKATVRYWLKEYGLQTIWAERRSGSAAGRQRMVLNCASHGLTEFQLRRGGGGYKCLKCRSEAVVRRRRRIKQILIEEAGGACLCCGYSRCVAALQFHHVEPDDKSFELSRRGVTRSLDRARAEAKKCVLLCANCHAEVEAGVRVLP
jgi:transposase